MNLNQINTTQTLLAPFLSGDSTDVGSLTNCAIGVMQEPLPQTIADQYNAAHLVSAKLGFWIPEFHSGDLVDQFTREMQPLFLRGVRKGAQIEERIAKVMFSAPIDREDMQDFQILPSLRSYEMMKDYGAFDVDAAEGLRTGILAPDSILFVGARLMHDRLIKNGKGWLGEIFQCYRDSLGKKIDVVNEILNSKGIGVVDDRINSALRIARAGDYEMFTAGSSFRIALLRERTVGAFGYALPLFAFDSIYRLPQGGKASPFIVVSDGQDVSVRYLHNGVRFDLDNRVDNGDLLNTLSNFGALGNIMVTPRKFGLSDMEQDYVDEDVVSLGWMRFADGVISLSGIRGDEKKAWEAFALRYDAKKVDLQSSNAPKQRIRGTW